MDSEFKVEPNGRGQFTATVNGKFFGNYDTIQEAVRDYELELAAETYNK